MITTLFFLWPVKPVIGEGILKKAQRWEQGPGEITNAMLMCLSVEPSHGTKLSRNGNVPSR